MRKSLLLITAILLSFGILCVNAEEATDATLPEEATEVIVLEEATEAASIEEPTAVTLSEEPTEVASFDEQEPSVSFYVNGNPPLSWINAEYSGDILYLPAVATANLLGINANIIDYYSSPATILTKDENCCYFFNDNYYAIINSTAIDMENPSKIINGILYLPSDIFTSVFGVECTVTKDASLIKIDFKTTTPDPKAEQYESAVAALKLTSSTDYLIWVSKANYSVRLFTKANGKWRFEQEFPCSIGKLNTPTCEGTYKYYEKIKAWKYDKYYVGPVMRFNRGYALHSTLVRYNGTAYDDRVGMNISAGCVRMHPDDIQYLWDTVPLQTTVHISAN